MLSVLDVSSMLKGIRLVASAYWETTGRLQALSSTASRQLRQGGVVTRYSYMNGISNVPR